MACLCGGSGFVTFFGDFKSNVSGLTFKHVEQVRRCPGWWEYFSTRLLRDCPEKAPVSNAHGVCSAARRAHEKLIAKAESKRRDDKEL